MKVLEMNLGSKCANFSNLSLSTLIRHHSTPNFVKIRLKAPRWTFYNPLKLKENSVQWWQKISILYSFEVCNSFLPQLASKLRAVESGSQKVPGKGAFYYIIQLR